MQLYSDVRTRADLSGLQLAGDSKTPFDIGTSFSMPNFALYKYFAQVSANKNADIHDIKCYTKENNGVATNYFI